MAGEETITDVNVGSDQSLFDAAMAPDPAPEQQPEPTTRTDGRDEHGRFAPRAPAQAQPQAPVQQQPSVQQQQDPQQPAGNTDDDNAMVPSWRLREEREARAQMVEQMRARDQQIQEMMGMLRERQQPAQPKQEAAPFPDPLVDPVGYANAVRDSQQESVQSIMHQIRTNQLESNLQLTKIVHGEIFDQAYEAFMEAGKSDPQFARAIVNSPNPGAALVGWYKRASALQTVGDDPEAWFNNRLGQVLADPAFLGKAVENARALAEGRPLPHTAVAQAMAAGAQQPQQRQQPNAARQPAPPLPTRPNNVTILPPSLSRVGAGAEPDGNQGPGGVDQSSNEALFAFARGNLLGR